MIEGLPVPILPDVQDLRSILVQLLVKMRQKLALQVTLHGLLDRIIRGRVVVLKPFITSSVSPPQKAAVRVVFEKLFNDTGDGGDAVDRGWAYPIGVARARGLKTRSGAV